MWLRAKCLRCTVLEARGDSALKTHVVSYFISTRSHCVNSAGETAFEHKFFLARSSKILRPLYLIVSLASMTTG